MSKKNTEYRVIRDKSGRYIIEKKAFGIWTTANVPSFTQEGDAQSHINMVLNGS